MIAVQRTNPILYCRLAPACPAQTQMAAIEGGRFNDPTIFLPLVDPTFTDKTILERNAGPEQIAPVNPDAIVLKTSARHPQKTLASTRPGQLPTSN